jgi:hypothetical protein
MEKQTKQNEISFPGANLKSTFVAGTMRALQLNLNVWQFLHVCI